MTAFGLGLFAFLLLMGGGAWIVIYRARKQGAEQQRAKAAEQALKDAQEAARIANEVEGQTNAELDADIMRDSRDRGAD